MVRPVTLRSVKGAPLTHNEVDDNFSVLSNSRELLTAARTYYVRTDGSDSNDGLANTAGGAFLTLQYAYEYVVNNLDLGGFIVTLQFADGTYVGTNYLYSIGPVSNGALYIRGNLTNPENVVFTTPFYFYGLAGSTWVCINGITLPNIEVGYKNVLWVGVSPSYSETAKVRFTATNYNIYGEYGANIEYYGTLILDGATRGRVVWLRNLATITYADPGTITAEDGAITISTAFLELDNRSSVAFLGNTAVSGTFTGPRIKASNSSFVNTSTNTQSVCPGDSDGTIDATSVLV